jgi:hypothetical protein
MACKVEFDDRTPIEILGHGHCGAMRTEIAAIHNVIDREVIGAMTAASLSNQLSHAREQSPPVRARRFGGNHRSSIRKDKL